ncbi:MAG: nucleotide exchange factor GrpE [Acidobacteria bacterium]|nr:MAG: nucleotide exchange factor GrpE [Acidobacteriota bacterium]PYV32340.1 MAG: nucleotide exchange factor GrpE [Acidobacteriota bacterium]
MTRLYMRPSESSGLDGQTKTTTAEEAIEAKPEQEGPDPLAQLQAGLSAAKTESEQWRDRFLRKAAEFENYRKRIEREKGESILLAKSSVLAELLPIVDAYERALGSFSGEDAGACLEQYREGFLLMYRQLADTLARLGVVPIAARGETFDPNLHEALCREETIEYDENTVMEELRTGYMYGDRLLRPAQVKVAIRPQAPPRQPVGEKDV